MDFLCSLMFKLANGDQSVVLHFWIEVRLREENLEVHVKAVRCLSDVLKYDCAKESGWRVA